MYGFAAGDPINFTDPFGLCPKGFRHVKAPEDSSYCINDETDETIMVRDWIKQRAKEREEARRKRRSEEGRLTAPRGCGFRGAPKCPGVDYDTSPVLDCVTSSGNLPVTVPAYMSAPKSPYTAAVVGLFLIGSCMKDPNWRSTPF